MNTSRGGLGRSRDVVYPLGSSFRRDELKDARDKRDASVERVYSESK